MTVALVYRIPTADCEVTEAGLAERVLHPGGEPEQNETYSGAELRSGDRYSSDSGCVPGDRILLTPAEDPVVDSAGDTLASGTIVLVGFVLVGAVVLAVVATFLLRNRRRR